jgi:flavin reductase (DIM6/NTAB) family NADH-FMN oxidoreductase RutF
MEQKSVISAGAAWTEKSIRDFRGSPSQRISEEWALLTAGNTALGAGHWNTMTVSWGGLGVLWGRDVAAIYVRPHRHTLEFLNANTLFTISFFDKKHHKTLAFCGEKSGRDYDKAAETGITPVVFDSTFAGGRIDGAVAFKEAAEVIVCKKIYTHDFDPAKFLDPRIERECYPQKDYHRMFIGEILTLLTVK